MSDARGLLAKEAHALIFRRWSTPLRRGSRGARGSHHHVGRMAQAHPGIRTRGRLQTPLSFRRRVFAGVTAFEVEGVSFHERAVLKRPGVSPVAARNASEKFEGRRNPNRYAISFSGSSVCSK